MSSHFLNFSQARPWNEHVIFIISLTSRNNPTNWHYHCHCFKDEQKNSKDFKKFAQGHRINKRQNQIAIQFCLIPLRDF